MSGFTPLQQPQQPKQQSSGFTPTGGSGFQPVGPTPKTGPSGPLNWNKLQAAPLPKPSAANEQSFPVIDREADSAGVPRSVARAVYLNETGGNMDPTHAGDPNYAYGPFQIEKATAPHLDRSNLQDSTKWAMGTLSNLHKKYGSWELAGIAYNAGQGAVDKWLADGGDMSKLAGIAGPNNNPAEYGMRIHGALTQEQADMAHKNLQVRDHNLALDRAKQTAKLLKEKAQKDQGDAARLGGYAMKVMFPVVGMGMEAIQSPVIQGPLQALGSYYELITGASPLIGAALGRSPDVPHMPTPSGPMTMANYERVYGTKAKQDYQAWEAGKHHDPQIAQAYHDVISAALRGPQSLATAEERYSLGSPGFAAATGKTTGDPRGDVALRMGLDMLSLNPAGMLGWVGKVAKVVPGVDKAMTAAAAAGGVIRWSKPVRVIADEFLPYAAMRRAAEMEGKSQDVAEAAGRQLKMNDPVVRARAAELRQQIFKGTTAEQREEIGRRSQTLIRGEDVQPKNLNVPEPEKGPSLDDRAAVERHLRMMGDDKGLARRLMDKTFDPWTFLNATGPNVWKKSDRLSDLEEEVIDKYGARGPAGRGVSGKGTSSARAPGKVLDEAGKVKYRYYDQMKASGLLSSKFDFADQFERQMIHVGKLIGVDDAINAIKEVAGKDITYKTPTGEVLGTGEKGHAVAQGIGKRIDRYNATQKTLNDLGMTSEYARSLSQSNPDIIARVVRAQQVHQKATDLAERGLGAASRAAKRLEENPAKREMLHLSAEEQAQTEREAAKMTPSPKITKKTDEDAAARALHIQTSTAKAMAAAQKAMHRAGGAASEAHTTAKEAEGAKVAWRISQAIHGPKSPLARESARLLNNLFTKEIMKPELLRYQSALKANLKAEGGKAFDIMQKAAQEAAGGTLGDYIAEKSGILARSLKPWATFNPQAADFIIRQGATREEAGSIIRALSWVTNAYRMGVVYGPFRHGFINLFFKSLFLGMTPKNLLRAYVGGRDLKWEAGLEKHTGLQTVTYQPMFGGSRSTAFDTPLKNVYSEAYKKAGDTSDRIFGAKAVQAAGETFNAGVSRLWKAQGDFVFNTIQKRMQVSLFRQLVEEGKMDPAKAANEAAKFWDSANVNKTGTEAILTKALLFYPWLKGIIPAAMRAMVTHPQYVWMPYSRAQDWNRATGDPRWSQESEGTIYMGQLNGEDQYMSFPGPQKYLHDVLSVVAPSDGSGQIQGRLTAAMNLATGEMIPPIAQGVKLIKTLASKPTEPGPPNFDILWDKAAPPNVQHSQLLDSELQQLPFGEGITKTIQGIEQAKQNIPGTILSALSFNPYSRPSEQIEKAQRKQFTAYLDQEGKIQKNLYEAKSTPHTAAWREANQRSEIAHWNIEYLRYKMNARLLDPGLSVTDKKTIQQQTAAAIGVYQKERDVYQKLLGVLDRTEPKGKAGLQPHANPTATPSAAPQQFTPAAQPTPGGSGFTPINQ